MDLQTAILAAVGAVISLVFSYLPAAKNWYDAQENKGLIMLGVTLAVSVVYFALACSPFAADLKIVLSCSQAGALQLIQVFLTIALANQGTYLFSQKGTAKSRK